MENKKKILALGVMALPMALHAQMLRVEIPDTALQNGAKLYQSMEATTLKFNAKGVCEFSDENIKGSTTASIMLKDYSFYSVVLEPGKTMTLKIADKKGKRDVKYGGDNAPMALFMNQFNDYYPARSWAYEQNLHKTDTISFDEAFRQNAQKHDEMAKLVAKIKDDHDRMICRKSLEMRRLKNDISLQKDWLTAHNLDMKADGHLKALMAQVLPNDSDHVSYGLVSELINYSMPIKVDQNTDVTDYGIHFLQTTDRLVTDRRLRDALMEGMLPGILGADNVDVDRFWTVACRLCDKKLTDKYQYIVDSKKTTRSGMKCPDAAFTDADGKIHHLSEFFGKVLYIDLWATWCGPCCMEIPYMDKRVEHYKDNARIQFVSISLDRDRKAWLKKIENDQPAWPQFNADSEQDKVISKQWGVTGIPRFLIINADGTINNADAFRPSDDEFVSKIDAILKAQP